MVKTDIEVMPKRSKLFQSFGVAFGTIHQVSVKKLDTLAATLDQFLEQEKEIMKRDPEVVSKRCKRFQSFGIALGSISPSKRLSRGLSLTG